MTKGNAAWRWAAGGAVLAGVVLAGVLAVQAGALDAALDRPGAGALARLLGRGDPAARPLPERYRHAASFEEFVAEHEGAARGWDERYARAGGVVARWLPAVRSLDGKWRLLVVTEAWCGDSRHTIPVLARLAAEADGLELRILRRRDAPDLLAAHPHDDGRQAIPLVLVLDPAFRVRGAWVEQPAPLQALIEEATGHVPGDQLHDRVLAWYAADAGRTALAEVVALIQAAASEEEEEEEEER